MYALVLLPLFVLASLVAIFSLTLENPDNVAISHYPYGEIDN